jgi:hypothetical protein
MFDSVINEENVRLDQLIETWSESTSNGIRELRQLVKVNYSLVNYLAKFFWAFAGCHGANEGNSVRPYISRYFH